MSDKELAELIHKYIYESFNANQSEFYNTFNSLISGINPATQEQADNMSKALFDYTVCVSEMNCAAIFKILSSMGILTISSSSD